MKNQILFLTLCCLSMFSFAQDEKTYDKTEHLIKTAGMVGFGGWDLAITYKINSKNVSVSDTTFTLFCNSAAYTQITETFTMFRTNKKSELETFVRNLDTKLLEIPAETSVTEGEYRYAAWKNKKILDVWNLSTGRTDSYTYFTDNVSKKLWKAIATLK